MRGESEKGVDWFFPLTIWKGKKEKEGTVGRRHDDMVGGLSRDWKGESIKIGRKTIEIERERTREKSSSRG